MLASAFRRTDWHQLTDGLGSCVVLEYVLRPVRKMPSVKVQAGLVAAAALAACLMWTVCHEKVLVHGNRKVSIVDAAASACRWTRVGPQKRDAAVRVMMALRFVQRVFGDYGQPAPAVAGTHCDLGSTGSLAALLTFVRMAGSDAAVRLIRDLSEHPERCAEMARSAVPGRLADHDEQLRARVRRAAQLPSVLVEHLCGRGIATLRRAYAVLDVRRWRPCTAV